MDERTDGTLLTAWRDGNQEAFASLVRRHEVSILRHTRALLGAWRGGEDVVQEVFLRLAQKPPELPPESAGDADFERAVLSRWLHTVTRNLCMDAMRREQRRRRREQAAAGPEAHAGGLDEVEAADTKEAVEKGLSRLPADQREVLVLRLFDEKSYKEIAEITGKKVGTIGWLISVGLKALAGELAPFVSPSSNTAPASGRVQSLPGGLS